MPGFPRPEEAEASSVPTDDRFGFHDHQRGTPVPPSYRQPSPQEPIRRGQLRSFHRPLHNGELMAQSQHLHLKVCTAAKTIPQRSPNRRYCRKCGEKTEEDQPSMYQSDSNLREPQAQAEIVKLAKEFEEAMITNDATRIGSYLADDWIIIAPDGGIIDKVRFLSAIRSGTLVHEAMDSGDVRVRVFDTTAVVTALTSSRAKCLNR